MAGEGAVEHLAGLGEIADRYDALLCDVWGVVHNGVAFHGAAVDALRRFRERGPVVLVTNAPRPAPVIAVQLDGLRVPREAYDAVVTSGDLTRGALEARAGEPVHHIGPPRDLPLFEGLPLRFAPLNEAGTVVCTGLFDDERDTPEDYRGRLEGALARALPMICANPDLVVDRGGRLVPCAGAIAALYEGMGGSVLYAGKPHRPIYEASLARASAAAGRPLDPGRVLAIGDALRTDIAGATAFGLDALFIAAGIHAVDLRLAEAAGFDPARAARWLAEQGARPVGFMEELRWE